MTKTNSPVDLRLLSRGALGSFLKPQFWCPSWTLLCRPRYWPVSRFLSVILLPNLPECSFSKLVEKFIFTDVRTSRETGLAILVLFQRFYLHVDSSPVLVHCSGERRKAGCPSWLLDRNKMSTAVKVFGTLWVDAASRYTEVVREVFGDRGLWKFFKIN